MQCTFLVNHTLAAPKVECELATGDTNLSSNLWRRALRRNKLFSFVAGSRVGKTGAHGGTN